MATENGISPLGTTSTGDIAGISIDPAKDAPATICEWNISLWCRFLVLVLLWVELIDASAVPVTPPQFNCVYK